MLVGTVVTGEVVGRNNISHTIIFQSIFEEFQFSLKPFRVKVSVVELPEKKKKKKIKKEKERGQRNNEMK